ncbi:MAG: hypothetical protein JNM36_04370 [Chitinophagales bacterium]|nr:hypothetical protein [Chitinophagales bacterium]
MDKVVRILKQHFCDKDSCFEPITQERFGVKDTAGKVSVMVSFQSAESQFDVCNVCAQMTTFLKIDNCLFSDGDDSKCDFGLSSDVELILVELKIIEPKDGWQTRKDTHKQRKNKRKESYEQLANTLNIFATNNILEQLLSQGINIIAIASVFDHNEKQKIPATTSSSQDQIAFFTEEYTAELLVGHRYPPDKKCTCNLQNI